MKIKFLALIGLSFTLSTCGTMDERNQGKGFNLFTVEQDRQLGAQVAAEIEANPQQFPVLDSLRYKEVYQYIYKVRNTILNSGQVDFKDEFPWRIRVISDDKTLNAFCTPGGYIYVYTGILKFLTSEDEFAGVLAHEIAHADMRHSTRQMTKQFGIQVLLQIIAGDMQLLREVTAAIINLKFSRQHETEADQHSVIYLCPTTYNADAGARFFEKIEALGGERPPEFLSTHPNPANRIETFKNLKVTMGCTGANTYQSEYQQMIARLPK